LTMASSIIEEGLGGIARIRILGLLAKSGEGLTRYAISTASGLGYRDIDWTLSRSDGSSPRRYRINVKDEGSYRVAKISSLFRASRPARARAFGGLL
jgi:hypothetical protein